MAQQPCWGLGHLKVSRLHTDTPHPLENIWTRDWSVSETYTFTHKFYEEQKSGYKENKECRICTGQPALTHGNTVTLFDSSYFDVIFLNFLLYHIYSI
jgi:hypothetical protein